MSFNVSTSEVATFLTCNQRWMYAHHPSYNLEPRTLGVALTRGLIGHEALEIYYSALMDGKPEADARKSAQDFIVATTLKEVGTDPEKAKMVASLGVRLKEYFDDNLELLKNRNIIGVEHKVIAPLTPEINFAGRIDLLLEIASGVNKGEAEPYDHKFTYNFWPEVAVKMNAQISNYVWAVRETGTRSRRGYLNMIRYRDDARADFKFKREEVPTNSTLRKNFIANHLEAAKVIVELKQKEKVGLSDGVKRSTSKFNCEYCPFAELCLIENMGQDSKLMIRASFRPNSYGYDSELDVA